MKKHLFTILITLFSITLFSQSIPNGGFENWTTVNYENPLGYQSSNLHGNHGSIGTVNVVKTTDAYHGSYAIKLTTSTSGLDTNFAYYANGDPGKTPPVGGMPYSQTPTGIRFHYKSNIMAGDSSLVLLEFKKNGVLIGQYFWAITASQSVYTLFTKTLSPALPMAPDTVVIGVASSFPFGGNRGIPGTMLQVDSVSFTGVASQPANFNGDLESWQSYSNSQIVGWQVNGFNQGGNYQTTDKYSGTYAIELQTQPPSFGGGGVQAANAITGHNVSNGPPRGGLPYNKKIDTLVFYYKYLPADPNDSARIDISFSLAGSPLYGVQKFMHTAGGYQMMQVPFNITGSPPDSVMIGLSSSSYSTNSLPASYSGSDLKVDNMYFKSQKMPVANFNLPISGCIGQPIQLLDNSANMVSGWNWIMSGASPSSSTSQNPIITYASVGTKTITLYATNFIGTTNTSAAYTRTIAIYTIPSVNVTSTVICGGANANLVASGATSYTWSSGQNTASITVTPPTTTNYTVTGTTNGCSNTAIASVNVPIASSPNICMVTADSLFANNMIYWDKTSSSKIDSFIIYREVSTNVYKRIGAQPYSYYSRFKDTARSVGPANGDPNITSYRYKLQMRDSCGNYSALSPYHNTVYFTAGTLGNYSWNLYNVEGTSTPVSTFSLFRDNLASGTWTLVGSTAGTQTTLNDPAYASWPNAVWRVDALGFNCNPSYKTASPTQQVNKSKSNVKNNLNGVPTSITNAFTAAFSMAPNPVNSELTVSFTEDVKTKTTILITDVLGKEIYKAEMTNGSKLAISLADINSGIYFLTIEQGNSKSVKKFVKD